MVDDKERKVFSDETVSKTRLRCFELCFVLFLFSVCFSLGAAAQEIPDDAEPPPLKVISKEEREKLFSETKLKDRTKLSLELMDVRLQKAEQLLSEKKYAEMFKELGRFHALVDNGLAFLSRNNTGRGKVLDSFKRLDIGLRAFLPRLELIRRDLPSNFEFYVRTLIKNVREARSNAVDPLFGNTVLPKGRDREN